MANLKHKTKGDTDLQGKPRVYFCCHSEDFEKYFDMVADEILKKQDCAIWYTDKAVNRDDDFFADLKQMQLFVMPVTANLLFTPNHALDIEFKFAVQSCIPVLPLMQEDGLEEQFNIKCGELQFLGKNTANQTDISYSERLNKYLDAVLIGDELAEKVRAAFDAYIFLSYRKKDRKYARELMRLIHKNNFCRDIAIWYDEFLTPGENFNKSIEVALQKSGLFVLTVTPNLVNEPNYIMETEYPLAKQEGKPIFAAELVPTNRKKLLEKYNGIPTPTDAYNEFEFSEALLKAVKKMAVKRHPRSPEHDFLIGLAYLSGIDVEVDFEKAIKLITAAAEAGLPEAMKKLCDMYTNGIGVRLNYTAAMRWTEKLYEAYKSTLGENHDKTVAVLWDLMTAYLQNGEADKAISLAEKKYQATAEGYGENDTRTLYTLHWVATGYSHRGEYKKALEIAQKLYAAHSEKEGENHESTMSAASIMANAYFRLESYEKALPIYQRIYDYCLKKFSQENSDTLLILICIAETFLKLGDYEKSLELSEKAYELCADTLGEKHKTTAQALQIIATNYIKLNQAKKGLLLSRRAYGVYCYIYGPEHSATISALSGIGSAYLNMKKYKRAIEVFEAIYNIQSKKYGGEHLNCVSALENLATAYNGLKKRKKAQYYSELALDIQRKSR
ncbi:MAG: tetratricopeptide repeat protein [Clostridia bacterium]|nr:tetratricopeptide repeat protein [Clostridia bacterium]